MLCVFFVLGICFNQSALGAGNQLPKGFFDSASCIGFSGWTCDADDYSKPLRVDFYADGPVGSGVFVGSADASGNREAAVGAECGGNALHGFYFPAPASLRNGASHNIFAYAINAPAGDNLFLGSKTINGCGGCQSQCPEIGTQCYGTAGYQTCSDTNGDGCFELSSVFGCAAGQVCAGGDCIAPPSSEKRLDIGATGQATGAGFKLKMFFFPLPAGIKDINILGLSGSVSMTATTAVAANLLTWVGYRHGDCPVNGYAGTVDTWGDLGQYGELHPIFAYILKTFNPGLVSTPTEFRLPQKMPAGGCIFVLLNGGAAESGDPTTLTSNISLVYDTAPAIANAPYQGKLDYEYFFDKSPCNSSAYSRAYTSNYVSQDTKLLGIYGNVSVAAYMGSYWPSSPVSPWTAYIDGYVYRDCSSMSVGENQLSDYYNKIPADAVKIYSAELRGIGRTALHSSISNSFSAVTLHKGDCIVSLTKCVSSIPGQADFEIQLPPILQATVCVPNTVSGCKVCKSDGSAWSDDNSKCAANQTCQSGQCATPCAGWSHIANIAGVLKYDPSVMASNGKLIITGTGGDNALWANEFNPANNQNEWYLLEGVLASGTGMADAGGGKITVTAVGSDGAVWKRIYQSPKNWSNWAHIGSASFAAGPNSAIIGQTTYKVIRKQDGSTEIGKCAAACVPKTCTSLGNYQCGSWSDGCSTTLNCGACASGQTCSNGRCVSNCISHASKKCDSGDLYWYNSCNAKESLAQDCGNDQPTSIYRCNGSWTQRETIKKVCTNNACASESAWADDADCAVSGKICRNGACQAACTSECTVNDKKCDGTTGFKTCALASGCLKWGATTNCSSGQSCSGAGVCQATCVPTCATVNAKQCSGNAVQTCETSGGCLKWSTAVACPTNQTCSNGNCSPTCTNECTSGAKQCVGTAGFKTCAAANGCLRWGAATNCPSGQICSGAGLCAIPVCVPKTCAALGIYECGSWPNGCGGAINCGACGSEKTCDANGRCVFSGGAGTIIKKEEPRQIIKMTRAQILAKINEIVALIAKLQAQLKAMTGSRYSCAQITKNLFYGIKNDVQVKCLQEVLQAQGYAVVPTGDYGGITKAAVKQFQEKYAKEILAPYGLRVGSGNVGNSTKIKINALIVK